MSIADGFEYDSAKAAFINIQESIRLIKAFRYKDESVFLQLFKDGEPSCYTNKKWVGKDGKERDSYEYGIRVGGKLKTGKCERSEHVNLDQLESVLNGYKAANMARVGVFWTVNVVKAAADRRLAQNIERVTAVFLDLDGEPLPDSFPIQPTAIVESSAGRYHVYWVVEDLPLSEFEAVQKHLAALYAGDSRVCDLPRVMRLAGFWHGKHEEGYLTRILELNEDARYTRADLVGAFYGLGDALAPKPARSIPEPRERVSSGTGGSMHLKYAQAALAGVLESIRTAPEGQSNEALGLGALRVGELLHLGLDEAECVAELEQAATERGCDPITPVIQNRIAKGKTQPFTPPPLPEREMRATKQGKGVFVKTTNGQIDPVSIPDPEGEKGSYSDDQILKILGIEWPVRSAISDKAHSYRLQELVTGDLSFVAELGGYVAWNGKQWLSGGKDGAGQVEAAKRVLGLGLTMRKEEDILFECFLALNEEALKAFRKYGEDSFQYKKAEAKSKAMEYAYHRHIKAAQATEGDNKTKTILSAARPLFRQEIKRFEPHAWVVGFQNGTWDKGKFRKHEKEDYMLDLAPVEYEPDTNQRDWLQVLEVITGGDIDFAQTLQDIAGYALSGASSKRILPWLYGGKGTGKSTFSELLCTVLGGMAETIDTKHLSSDGARERLGAAIWGKRVALVSEAGNARLDAELLKTLSGSDRYSVRKLYAESFTASPSHVLVMVANDAPNVAAYDDALKDRVWALPFNYPLKASPVQLVGGRDIEAERRDPHSALVRGFTAWSVTGLARVHSTGKIHKAEVCKHATQRFWIDVDPLKEFWFTQDISELVMGVKASDFRARYISWCEKNEVKPLGIQNWSKACEGVGFKKKGGAERRLALLRPDLFPTEAAQVSADDLDTLTLLPPNFIKVKTHFLRGEESLSFTENDLRSVKVSNQDALDPNDEEVI